MSEWLSEALLVLPQQSINHAHLLEVLLIPLLAHYSSQVPVKLII